MTRETFRMASAYMSVIIGGGFASGQEILQFFTSYGLAGFAGTLVSALMFAFTGRQLAQISNQSRAASHKQVLALLFGQRFGTLIDLVMVFFLFGVGVVMLAGTASLFKEDLGLPMIVGGLFMTVVVTLTLCLNIRRIVTILSSITPLLLGLVIVLAIYAMWRVHPNMDELTELAGAQKEASPHWFLSGILYAAFNIAVGFPMLAVMAGGSHNGAASRLGGLLGGLGLGILIFLLALSLFFNLDLVEGSEVPTLVLAKALHPVIGTLMSIVVLCMMYTTATGMFFAFSARFATPDTNRFRLVSLLSCFIGLGVSFAGFTTLVGTVYPLLGVIGTGVALAAGVYWYRQRR